MQQLYQQFRPDRHKSLNHEAIKEEAYQIASLIKEAADIHKAGGDKDKVLGNLTSDLEAYTKNKDTKEFEDYRAEIEANLDLADEHILAIYKELMQKRGVFVCIEPAKPIAADQQAEQPIAAEDLPATEMIKQQLDGFQNRYNQLDFALSAKRLADLQKIFSEAVASYKTAIASLKDKQQELGVDEKAVLKAQLDQFFKLLTAMSQEIERDRKELEEAKDAPDDYRMAM